MTDIFDVPGVDELFEGELDDFVKRRDELARELKNNGDKDAAAAVKQLRKPSTVLWAVNQVARRSHAAVDDLVRAARKVHAEQTRAVQGKDAGGLRTSTNDWRNRVRALAAEVARLVGEQYRDDAAATFEAASINEETAAALRGGRLLATLSPSGFGLEGMPEPSDEEVAAAAPQRAKPEPAAKPPGNERAIAQARAKLDAAEAAMEKVTHALRRAEQRLEQARLAADDSQKAYDQALAARDEAAAALRDAEGA